MYKLYFGNMLMPITPDEIDMKINGQNKTINLINEGEVNVIKPAGLTDISFDLLLPNSVYPFAQYKNNVYNGANFYLDKIEALKTEKKPFQFIVVRAYPNGNVMYNTNMTVTIEDYSIKEKYDYGNDVMVSIKLKQYVTFGTKTAVIKAKKKVKKKAKRSNTSKKKYKTYVVKKGDTLWKIAKKLLGDGNKCWNLAKLNKISNPNKIYVGQVLKIEDVASSSGSTSKSSNKSSTKRKTASGKSTRSTKSQTSKSTEGYGSPFGMPLAGISVTLDKYYKSTSGSKGYVPYQGYSAYTWIQTKKKSGLVTGSTTHKSSTGTTHGGGGGRL